MEYFGINEDVNKFAQRFFKGEDIYGVKDEYDQEWKNYFAANPSIKVECKIRKVIFLTKNVNKGSNTKKFSQIRPKTSKDLQLF